jgi:hypothetical protein
MMVLVSLQLEDAAIRLAIGRATLNIQRVGFA